MGMIAMARVIEMPITIEVADFLSGQISRRPDDRPIKRVFFGETDASGVGESDGSPLGQHWQLTKVRSERTDVGEMVFGTFREVWP